MPVTVNNYGLIYNSDMCVTIRPDDVPFAGVKSIQVEQGTTNLIQTQTSGVQDWSKWSHWNNSTYWYSCTQYDVPFYGKVFEGVAKDKTYLYYYYPFTVTAGTTYTLSVYLKADRVLTNKQLIGYMTRGSDNAVIAQHSKTVTITTEWQRFDFQLTPSESRTNSAGIGINFGTGNDGIRYYQQLPQLEALPFATSFVNGSRSNGGLLKLVGLNINLNNFVINVFFKPTRYPTLNNTFWQLFNIAVNTSNQQGIEVLQPPFNQASDYGTLVTNNLGIKFRLSPAENTQRLFNTGYSLQSNINKWTMFTLVGYNNNYKAYINSSKVMDTNLSLYSTALIESIVFGRWFYNISGTSNEGGYIMSDLYIGKAYNNNLLIWTDEFIARKYNSFKSFR